MKQYVYNLRVYKKTGCIPYGVFNINGKLTAKEYKGEYSNDAVVSTDIGYLISIGEQYVRENIGTRFDIFYNRKYRLNEDQIKNYLLDDGADFDSLIEANKNKIAAGDYDFIFGGLQDFYLSRKTWEIYDKFPDVIKKIMNVPSNFYYPLYEDINHVSLSIDIPRSITEFKDFVQYMEKLREYANRKDVIFSARNTNYPCINKKMTDEDFDYLIDQYRRESNTLTELEILKKDLKQQKVIIRALTMESKRIQKRIKELENNS